MGGVKPSPFSTRYLLITFSLDMVLLPNNRAYVDGTFAFNSKMICNTNIIAMSLIAIVMQINLNVNECLYVCVCVFLNKKSAKY